jgi:hypothetical protein
LIETYDLEWVSIEIFIFAYCSVGGNWGVEIVVDLLKSSASTIETAVVDKRAS